MTDALIHRGPDDQGHWVADGIAIGMRRLSIIDLATGRQPILNEDGNLVIVMNGEIYNYRELREGLVNRGHRFRTHSDTEVVLHLFEEQGTATPDMLKGMFAFCILNLSDNSLFIARDRFGEKPLYYSAFGSEFVFSSELSSLMQSTGVPRKLNPEALDYYLRHRITASPLTMFRGVHQLPAGHFMIWKDGQYQQKCWYEYKPMPDATLDEHTAKLMVQDALLTAVQRQRVSDVPVGAFLSGGIDSSTIVAALQRQSGSRVPTFTARFENAAYDESPIARQVAEHLGTDHHEFVIPNQGFHEEDLYRVIRHMGQPFADSSAIPTYYICRQIRDQVTVCLSGDGGDEMFGGYNYFTDCLKVDRIAALAPRLTFKAMNFAARRLSQLPWLRRSSRIRQLTQVSSLASLPANVRFQHMAPLFDSNEVRKLIRKSVRETPEFNESSCFHRFSEAERYPGRLRQLMAYRVGFQLSEDMLVKVDRMSMATSLEVRAPMLDADLCEVAGKMPDHLLINQGVTKYILRQAARDWLPEAVFSHPKWGFAIPMHDYQNETYRHLCRDLLFEHGSIARQLFETSFLRKIVDRGLQRTHDAADVSVFRATHQVWALVQLAAWAKEFQVSV